MNERALALLLAASLLPSCAGTSRVAGEAAEPARVPVVYHAMSGPEIRGHMRVLAEELLALVELTMPEGSVDDLRRAAVLGSLGRIAGRARRVGGGGVVTNYSVVNDYMDAFLEDVALADAFARREPPNLVPANRLVQSCLACHRSL